MIADIYTVFFLQCIRIIPTFMRKISILYTFYLSCLLIASFVRPIFAGDGVIHEKNTLYQKYEAVHPKLTNTPFGVPILIETFFPDHAVHVFKETSLIRFKCLREFENLRIHSR